MTHSPSDRSYSINELLQMSMVPLPCQEHQLSSAGITSLESPDWLLDLKDKTPIWSRLNEINTSGFKRKLPMSMTKNYDIEINGRLWSLWGHKQKHRISKKPSKSYMAITMMALCTARVIRLNLWNTSLLDCIRDNGRKFYKKSLKQMGSYSKDFLLTNLDHQCSLEGISFEISFNIVQKGQLYGEALKSQQNLASALEQFFGSYQFGIMECGSRILGFGLIDGPKGGYFLFDAQTKNFPIFTKNASAPYLLRTNHLQVLLYCLIVSLNIPFPHTSFYLHCVKIQLIEPNQIKIDNEAVNSCTTKYPRIIPSKVWKTPSLFSQNSHQSSIMNSNLNLFKFKNRTCRNQPEHKSSAKRVYRRKVRNITKQQVEKSLIKPLVDPDHKSDEDIKVKKDFVRMICSETVVPLMPDDWPKSLDNEFSCNLLDALVIGPKTCLIFNDF